ASQYTVPFIVIPAFSGILALKAFNMLVSPSSLRELFLLTKISYLPAVITLGIKIFIVKVFKVVISQFISSAIVLFLSIMLSDDLNPSPVNVINLLLSK